MLWWILATAQAADRKEAETVLKKGMWSLNAWAVANIVSGAILSQPDDSTRSAFHQMNAGWNLVNAGLATSALVRSKPVEPQKLARVFWINAGLDVVYIAAGLALNQRGLQEGRADWEGWGNSIVLQGTGLLLFDGVMGWKMSRYSDTN